MTDKPRPCFVCLTEPAMDNHTVCDKHHDEVACRACNPFRRTFDAPVRIQGVHRVRRKTA